MFGSTNGVVNNFFCSVTVVLFLEITLVENKYHILQKKNLVLGSASLEREIFIGYS